MKTVENTPLVSIVIPTYNRSSTLYYALISVLNQTYQNFEIFVVDDASTDVTPDLIASFNDPRIKYIRFEDNRKAGAARNAGMEHSEGKYIAFLDSDDAWLPLKLEKQVALMESLSDEWGCSYTGAYVNKLGGITKQRVYKPKRSGDLLKDLLMNKFVIWTPTFMFRRSCLDKVGLMDVTLVRSQDVDFYIRLLAEYKIAPVAEPLVNIYMVLNKSLATIASQSRRRLLEKHGDRIDSLGVIASRYVRSMADMSQAEVFISEGDLKKGLSSFRQAVFRYPFLPIRRYAAISRHIVDSLFLRH
jgi:glycosyltransferase involved in cell wall biosynthesis